MSIAPVNGGSAAPATDPQVRKAAEGFERMLLAQLAKAMVPEELESGPYAEMLPDALADAMTGPAHPGGIGLAKTFEENAR